MQYGKSAFVLTLLVFTLIMGGCGGSNPTPTNSTGSNGSSSGNSGTGGSSGSGSAHNVPGYGEGIGASGQTGAAKFLYANPLPGGGPYAQAVQSNGTLTGANSGSANNLNPETMAIDPSGSYLFQTAMGYNSNQGGIFVYAIDRSTGSLGAAIGSYMTDQALVADVVDNQGKFLYALSSKGIYAFSIQSGSLTPLSGSPFSTLGPSSVGYSQPATLMAVDQTNKFLYVSTSSGLAAFNIDQNSGALTAIHGSPFAGGTSNSWTIVITPNNSFLYQQDSKDGAKIYGYSIDQNSGVLTQLSGSPFSAGTCGTMVPAGTIGVPGSDNMTIASAGKFMYDNCGIYSIDESTGSLAQVSNQGPGDWPVIDPTGDFLWAITGDQQSCFHCDEGVTTYQVDANTGALTAVPNSFYFLTNSEVGAVASLAITH